MSAASPLLRVEGVVKRFGGLAALSDVSMSVARRRDLRADRPERRGQDDFLQRDHRRVSAPMQGASRFEAMHIGGLEAPHDRRARHRAHVPEHPSLRQHDRARERDGRAPPAQPRGRHRRRFAEAAERGRKNTRSRSVPTRCSTIAASSVMRTSLHAISLTATSAGSKSRARLLPSRACSRWTSLLRA